MGLPELCGSARGYSDVYRSYQYLSCTSYCQQWVTVILNQVPLTWDVRGYSDIPVYATGTHSQETTKRIEPKKR